MPMQSRRVYVIDDDESVCTGLARVLRSEKFIVKTFCSADEFFSSSRQEQNACIILDLSMPGTHGFDLQKRLNASGTKIPVIIVSATGDEPVREYARHLGATAFFQKPVDGQALADAITCAIGSTRNAYGEVI